MLVALTKRRRDGSLYVRRTETTLLLTKLLSLGREELVTRLSIKDRRGADYVPSECLVYLLREARRTGNSDAWFNRLFTLLIDRCEDQIAHAIRYGAVPDAQSAREEVIERFMMVIAHGVGPKPEALDVFEFAFDKAFAALRFDTIRSVKRRQNETALIVSDGEDDEEVAGAVILAQPEAENEMGLLTAQLEVFRSQSDAAIDTLPSDERRVARLVLEGKNEKAIAKLCNVTDRTVRNRLKRSIEILTDKLHGDVP